MNHTTWLASGDLVQARAAECDTCLLSFSCGKDSIGAYVQIREHFRRIVPFYCYLIPDLQFVNESLEYYESVMGCHIVRLPHPSLYRMLNNLVFQPPERCAVIEAMNLPNFEYQDVYRILREDYDLPAESYVAVGVRAVDSPMRWRAIQQHGPENAKNQTFFPCYDWRIDQLEEAIAKSGIKLPIDYEWFGRSFDGIDSRFLGVLKERSPADYRRVLEWFPLADMETSRQEMRGRHAAAA